MTRSRSAARHHNLSPAKRRAKRAARAARAPKMPTPEEIAEIEARILYKLDRIAAVHEMRARERQEAQNDPAAGVLQEGTQPR